MKIVTEAQSKLVAELERIVTTFRKDEKNEYSYYIWSTTFAEWDNKVSTELATKYANEASEFADKVWDDYRS